MLASLASSMVEAMVGGRGRLLEMGRLLEGSVKGGGGGGY